MPHAYPFVQPPRPKLPVFPEPGDRDRLRKPGEAIVRAAAVLLRQELVGGSSEQLLKEMFPGADATTKLITRAAVQGADTTTAGWAAELVASPVKEFLGNLGPLSAGSALLKAATPLSFERGAAIVTALPSSAYSAFVAEDQPIPVKQLTVSSTSLHPRKLATIAVFSGELARHSQIELLVAETLKSSIALSLDAALFSTTAGDSTRPPGLMAGVTPLTATAGGGEAALLGDVSKIVTALAPIGGLGIVLIASPVQAAHIAMLSRSPFPFQVFASAALTNTLIGIVPGALAVATDPIPEIAPSKEAILHFEDAAPGQITTGAGAVSHPSRSLFQQDMVALRVLLTVNWSLRAAGSVAFIESVTW